MAGVVLAAILPGLLGEGAETPPPRPREPLFAEIELDFVYDNGAAGRLYLPEITCGGGALLDYDGDGDLDLFLVQGGALWPAGGEGGEETPLRRQGGDRLYRNDLEVLPGGGRRLAFTDVTPAGGLTAGGYGCGIATGDFDDDGRVDVYLTRVGENRLLKNRGDGTFEDRTAASGTAEPRWSVPAAFFDYDGDGRLDLYVGNYLELSPENHKICRTPTGIRDYCSPASFAGVSDRLFRNLGGGRFADVSESSGLAAVASKSLGVVTGDLDGDGRTDLYVANDGVANQLWLQGPDGRFREEGLTAGCAVNGRGQAEASMGVDAADFDGDGDGDLVMTHLTGETHTLFVNQGDGTFTDVTTASGLGPPSWPFTGWGVVWIDVDNDGWLDLAAVNGAVRRMDVVAAEGDPFPFHQPNQFFRNLGSEGRPGQLEEATAAAGPPFARSEVSRGLAAGDVDNDGDTDLLLINSRGPARLLINRVGQESPWLGLRLVTGPGGRDALGARVELRRPGRPPLARWVRTGSSYAAGHDPRVLFGLGGGTRIEAVRVLWPDGMIEEWRDLPVGAYTTLAQGTGRRVEQEPATGGRPR